MHLNDDGDRLLGAPSHIPHVWDFKTLMEKQWKQKPKLQRRTLHQQAGGEIYWVELLGNECSPTTHSDS